MSESTSPEIPKPILNEETEAAFPINDIDRQWELVTEAIRRDLIVKPEIRKTLSKFCTQSVSETLPSQFLSELSSVDKRVARLASRYLEALPGYLDLPAVPDEQIKPDLRLSYGLPKEERLMIAKRYKYARDAKILALGAEIIDQEKVAPGPNGEIILPSGIKIGMDTTDVEQRTDLLRPHLWERRRQIKDRVHEIFIGERYYILKEKKTSRHTDTKKHGHKEGRTSADEFAVAKHFKENGKLSQGKISVDWERPIGFVTYPDGFQFSVFEYEQDLISDNMPSRLAEEISAHREQFEEEYKLINSLSQKYKDHRAVLAFEEYRPLEILFKTAMKSLGIETKSSLQLTFEEFAMVKAEQMTRQARELMFQSVLQNEYTNNDYDGFAYRIHTSGEVKLDIVGFDFEYFAKISPERAAEIRENHAENRGKMESRDGIGRIEWDNGERVTRMQKAAYFAMLEDEGILLFDASESI
jgi:predicted metal-dependent phosphoesterase TrpH